MAGLGAKGSWIVCSSTGASSTASSLWHTYSVSMQHHLLWLSAMRLAVMCQLHVTQRQLQVMCAKLHHEVDDIQARLVNKVQVTKNRQGCTKAITFGVRANRAANSTN